MIHKLMDRTTTAAYAGGPAELAAQRAQLNEEGDTELDDSAAKKVLDGISDGDTSGTNDNDESGLSSEDEDTHTQQKKGMSPREQRGSEQYNAFMNEGGASAMAEYNKKLGRDVYEKSKSTKIKARNRGPVKTWNGAKSKLKVLRNAFFAKHGSELVERAPRCDWIDPRMKS